MFTLRLFMWVALSLTLEAEEPSELNLISLLRSKRHECPDGTYQNDGVTCCRCAPGQRLQKHCTLKPDDRICDFCITGVTYNSEPTFLDTCEPCRSCDPKANLEVEDKCTIRKNTVCRCQKGYYCDRAKEDCTACHPCKMCMENNVKSPCTATNNTICNETQNNDGTSVALAVTLPLIMIIIIIFVVFCWQKKKACFAPKVKSTDSRTGQEDNSPMEIPLLKGVMITRHVPDIAKIVGWSKMKDVAIRCGMTPAEIEAHQLNKDSSEWCQSLLYGWEERMGSQAAEKLVLNLRQMKMNSTAEQVESILRPKE